MPKFRRIEKDLIYEQARQIIQERKPEILETGGGCMYWTAAAIEAVTLEFPGTRIIVQAGTCLWPRLSEEMGRKLTQEPTHFGYVWESDSLTTALRLAMGALPEMHAWAALPVEQEIIDLTTGFFPQECGKILQKTWRHTLPPTYFWGGVNDLPEGVVYRPDPGATFHAMRYSHNFWSR